MLGSSAIADSKCDYGAALVILGLLVETVDSGIRITPSPCKVEKWLAMLAHAETHKMLPPWMAEKLAGGLSFGMRFQFKRLGRAMLRPLFSQAKHGRCKVGGRLMMAVRWWMAVLRLGIADVFSVGHVPPVFDLFCDARSSPPRVAAVLLDAGPCSLSFIAPCSVPHSCLQVAR